MKLNLWWFLGVSVCVPLKETLAFIVLIWWKNRLYYLATDKKILCHLILSVIYIKQAISINTKTDHGFFHTGWQ